MLPSGSTSIAVTRSTKYRKRTGWSVLHAQLINTHVMLTEIINSIGTSLLGKEGLQRLFLSSLGYAQGISVNNYAVIEKSRSCR